MINFVAKSTFNFCDYPNADQSKTTKELRQFLGLRMDFLKKQDLYDLKCDFTQNCFITNENRCKKYDQFNFTADLSTSVWINMISLNF